jgi:hypothetical protein
MGLADVKAIEPGCAAERSLRKDIKQKEYIHA